MLNVVVAGPALVSHHHNNYHVAGFHMELPTTPPRNVQSKRRVNRRLRLRGQDTGGKQPPPAQPEAEMHVMQRCGFDGDALGTRSGKLGVETRVVAAAGVRGNGSRSPLSRMMSGSPLHSPAQGGGMVSPLSGTFGALSASDSEDEAKASARAPVPPAATDVDHSHVPEHAVHGVVAAVGDGGDAGVEWQVNGNGVTSGDEPAIDRAGGRKGGRGGATADVQQQDQAQGSKSCDVADVAPDVQKPGASCDDMGTVNKEGGATGTVKGDVSDNDGVHLSYRTDVPADSRMKGSEHVQPSAPTGSQVGVALSSARRSRPILRSSDTHRGRSGSRSQSRSKSRSRSRSRNGGARIVESGAADNVAVDDGGHGSVVPQRGSNPLELCDERKQGSGDDPSGPRHMDSDGSGNEAAGRSPSERAADRQTQRVRGLYERLRTLGLQYHKLIETMTSSHMYRLPWSVAAPLKNLMVAATSALKQADVMTPSLPEAEELHLDPSDVHVLAKVVRDAGHKIHDFERALTQALDHLQEEDEREFARAAGHRRKLSESRSEAGLDDRRRYHRRRRDPRDRRDRRHRHGDDWARYARSDRSRRSRRMLRLRERDRQGDDRRHHHHHRRHRHHGDHGRDRDRRHDHDGRYEDRHSAGGRSYAGERRNSREYGGEPRGWAGDDDRRRRRRRGLAEKERGDEEQYDGFDGRGHGHGREYRQGHNDGGYDGGTAEHRGDDEPFYRRRGPVKHVSSLPVLVSRGRVAGGGTPGNAPTTVVRRESDQMSDVGSVASARSVRSHYGTFYDEQRARKWQRAYYAQHTLQMQQAALAAQQRHMHAQYVASGGGGGAGFGAGGTPEGCNTSALPPRHLGEGRTPPSAFASGDAGFAPSSNGALTRRGSRVRRGSGERVQMTPHTTGNNEQ